MTHLRLFITVFLVSCSSTPQLPPTSPDIKWYLADYPTHTLHGFARDGGQDLSLLKCRFPDHRGMAQPESMICYVIDEVGYARLQNEIISLEAKLQACEKR